MIMIYFELLFFECLFSVVVHLFSLVMTQKNVVEVKMKPHQFALKQCS